MKKTIFSMCIVLLSVNLIVAQTKRIAFKSHSGNAVNFKKSLNTAIFDHEGSNFGMAPQRYVTEAFLDTVIFINDSTVELVTSHLSHFESDNYRTKPEPSVLWKPGHETVVNHPVFNSDKTLEEMKEIIQKTYYFKNDISKVVFIGEPKAVKKKIDKKLTNSLKNSIVNSD